MQMNIRPYLPDWDTLSKAKENLTTAKDCASAYIQVAKIRGEQVLLDSIQVAQKVQSYCQSRVKEASQYIENASTSQLMVIGASAVITAYYLGSLAPNLAKPTPIPAPTPAPTPTPTPTPPPPAPSSSVISPPATPAVETPTSTSTPPTPTSTPSAAPEPTETPTPEVALKPTSTPVVTKVVTSIVYMPSSSAAPVPKETPTPAQQPGNVGHHNPAAFCNLIPQAISMQNSAGDEITFNSIPHDILKENCKRIVNEELTHEDFFVTFNNQLAVNEFILPAFFIVNQISPERFCPIIESLFNQVIAFHPQHFPHSVNRTFGYMLDKDIEKETTHHQFFLNVTNQCRRLSE